MPASPGFEADSATNPAPVRTTPAPQERGWYVLAVLSTLMGFASISTDFYLPAMPVMSRALGADAGMIQLTVSGYLIGFSIGQLVWGPIGDRYGRRIPIAVGLVLFAAGSAGCALSGSAWEIIIWRVVQAVGACAGVVLARAMVRDLYEGAKSAQMLSTLMTVMAIAPLLGPSLGGQIVDLAGWRAVFWTLVVIGVVTFAALFTIPETLPAGQRSDISLSLSMSRYVRLLGRRKLLGYAGVGGFFYAAIFASISGTPFAYIDYYHVPVQLYGLLFAIGIIGIMASSVVNARLVVRFGFDRMLKAGAIWAVLAAFAVAVAAFTGWGDLWGLVTPLVALSSATGFIVANSIAGALADFPDQAGAVSALVGAIQYGSGILGSALVGIFADGTPWPMGWVIAVMGFGGLLCTSLIDARATSR